MTKQEPITAANTALAAFIAAQKAMKRAAKDTANEHFKSRYADLASVQDACFQALHDNGFAVMQPLGRDEDGEYVETLFLHESGGSFSTRVYLKLGKPDMQGYGSAITYARRYGLMALSGVAPDDDDGNAAAKTPPVTERRTEPRKPVTVAAIDEEVASVEKKAKAITFAKDFAAKVAKAEGPLDAMQLVADAKAAIARLKEYPDALATVTAALKEHGCALTIRDGVASASEADIPDDGLPERIKEGARFMAAG